MLPTYLVSVGRDGRHLHEVRADLLLHHLQEASRQDRGSGVLQGTEKEGDGGRMVDCSVPRLRICLLIHRGRGGEAPA